MLFSRYKSQFIPVAAFVFSVIGLIYSLIMAFGFAAETLCLTSGCTIVQDFKVVGISPWWGAAVMFALLAALCFFRMRFLARLLASLFLVGDCVFLIIMFFIAPCSSCLLGGFIIFCCWLALRIDRAVLISARRIMAGALSFVWLVLFLLNLGYAANESIPAWKLNGDSAENAKVSVFFSPSCPACREAISVFSGRALFYPVAENERDYAVIADLASRVAAGKSVQEALEDVLAEQAAGSYAAPDMSLWGSLVNKIKVMRNQAAVTRYGYNVLPVLVFEGLPASWAGSAPKSLAPQQEEPAQSPAQDEPNFGSPDLPAGLLPNFNETLECDRSSAEPCDEPKPAPAQ